MRSLEMKWGQIKDDIARFIGVYKQCTDLQKSGTSTADMLRRAHKLFKQRFKSGTSEFQYEHCWILVRDHLRWIKG